MSMILQYLKIIAIFLLYLGRCHAGWQLLNYYSSIAIDINISVKRRKPGWTFWKDRGYVWKHLENSSQPVLQSLHEKGISPI